MKRDAVLLQVGIYSYYIAGGGVNVVFIYFREVDTDIGSITVNNGLSHLGACIERIGAWARSLAQIVALQRHIGTQAQNTAVTRGALR